MTTKTIGDQFRHNLVALRTAAGLSQSDLARRIGRGPSFVCDLERGPGDPSLRTLEMLAAGLGVSESRLIERGKKSHAKSKDFS